MRRKLKGYLNLYKFCREILNDLIDIHENSDR